MKILTKPHQHKQNLSQTQTHNPKALVHLITHTHKITNSQYITTGNLSIPNNWPTIIRRNLIHILLGAFSSSHMGGTVGKNHQTLFNKENARDTYFFTTTTKKIKNKK